MNQREARFGAERYRRKVRVSRKAGGSAHVVVRGVTAFSHYCHAGIGQTSPTFRCETDRNHSMFERLRHLVSSVTAHRAFLGSWKKLWRVEEKVVISN